MKLVCFSNNTAGGLVCDLLNNKQPMINSYRTTSGEHSVFKIEDTPTVQTTIDVDKWNQIITAHKNSDVWFGTHAHPGCIPNFDMFTKVIVITTESRQSKVYRWLRYYHGWFKSTHKDWFESDELDKIDKIRCLAKNIFHPFMSWNHPNCHNIEFEHIVSGKFVEINNLNTDNFNLWKKHNPWLYPVDETSWAMNRFIEAEYETSGSPYKYI